MQISNNYTRFSTCGVRSTSVRTGMIDGGSQASADTVEFSQAGRLKIRDLLKGLMLPTEENVRKPSSTLSGDLGSLLSGIGVASVPSLKFTVSSTGEIQIEGDCADEQKILETINGNEKMQQEIRTTAAIASHAAGMRESLKFQKEYSTSNNPEGVVAKYSYLFNSKPRSHQIALAYDGTGIKVLRDEKEWLAG